MVLYVRVSVEVVLLPSCLIIQAFTSITEQGKKNNLQTIRRLILFSLFSLVRVSLSIAFDHKRGAKKKRDNK